MKINILSSFILIYSLTKITCAKAARKSNVIAVFSEDDLSGKLPKPESVAAEIPQKLILQESNKLKAVVSNIPVKHKGAYLETEDNPSIKAKQIKRSKTKFKKRDLFDGDSLDRKSKSMNDHEEEEAFEKFIAVERNPLASQGTTNIIIPTASIVTVTETASLLGEIIKIAEIEGITRSQSEETLTVSPQKIRQFTPRSRMNVKRANSASNQYVLFDFKSILVISIVILFIINI